MKKIVSYLVLVALLLTLIPISLAGCATAPPATSTQTPTQTQTQTPIPKTTIRFSYALPEKHYISYQFQDWADLAMKKSNGSLEVKMYPAAQLYKDPDLYGAIMSGGIEAGHLYIFYDANYVPEANAWITWYLFDSTKEAYDVGLKSSLRTKVDTEMEKKGIKQLGWIVWNNESNCIITSKPVKVPADLKGMTMRAAGPEDAAWYQKWGATPSFISGADLYMGLQRGVIDGTIGGVPTSVERKLYEVAPYTILAPFYCPQASILGINKSFFDKLAPEQQKALVDAAKEVEGKAYDAAMKNLSEIMKRGQDLGLKYYTPTPEELKLWTAGKDEIRQQVYKDKPQVLTEINKLEEQLAAYRQKK